MAEDGPHCKAVLLIHWSLDFGELSRAVLGHWSFPDTERREYPPDHIVRRHLSAQRPQVIHRPPHRLGQNLHAWQGGGVQLIDEQTPRIAHGLERRRQLIAVTRGEGQHLTGERDRPIPYRRRDPPAQGVEVL